MAETEAGACGCGFLPDRYDTGHREAVICAKHVREHGGKALGRLRLARDVERPDLTTTEEES